MAKKVTKKQTNKKVEKKTSALKKTTKKVASKPVVKKVVEKKEKVEKKVNNKKAIIWGIVALLILALAVTLFSIYRAKNNTKVHCVMDYEYNGVSHHEDLYLIGKNDKLMYLDEVYTFVAKSDAAKAAWNDVIIKELDASFVETNEEWLTTSNTKNSDDYKYVGRSTLNIAKALENELIKGQIEEYFGDFSISKIADEMAKEYATSDIISFKCFK